MKTFSLLFLAVCSWVVAIHSATSYFTGTAQRPTTVNQLEPADQSAEDFCHNSHGEVPCVPVSKTVKATKNFKPFGYFF
jgi:hypothetical protein